ncbi:hypothetical protein MJP36_17700 [Pseudomonas palleroniana]|uniref:hypothetical protein n=1 Tax=Pseudomonas palleroniana TaxID=191390 RepID=UPI001FCAD56D|nr:hypothetical protein [Pseudomonas palleroniana]UOK36342.1 hypothetical protein MJP36_17700 [Pseudomonas palleroniana]
MLILENSALLQSLISQLSGTDGRSSLSLTGSASENLMGLRDLLQLEMITGEFGYGVIADPLGLLLTSAEAILLTKRGSLFSG